VAVGRMNAFHPRGNDGLDALRQVYVNKALDEGTEPVDEPESQRLKLKRPQKHDKTGRKKRRTASVIQL
jgi:hypothetical protein